MEQPEHRMKRAKSKTGREISRVELKQIQILPFTAPRKYEIACSDVAQLHFIGCFHNKVIVTYCARLDCFVHFDQHAIHERIRYEFYVEKLKQELGIASGKQATQFAQINPWVIEHRSGNIREVVSRRKVLKRVHSQAASIWGFRFEDRGHERYLVECPSIFGAMLTDPEINLSLKQQSTSSVPSPLDRLIASSSCKGAIKFNEHITQELAVELLKALTYCDFPFFCVHGRDSIYVQPNNSSQLQR